MTNTDYPGGAWSAAFASAPRSAMNVYAEVVAPRMFEPWAFEDGPEQLTATLAAALVAAGLEALSPPDKEGLHASVAELSRGLTADGALRSQLASYLAVGRR
jgi:hypothetical protein